MTSDEKLPDIQAKLLELSKSIRNSSQEICEQGPEYLLWWRTNVNLLPRFVYQRPDWTQQCLGLPPRLTCQEESEWSQFSRLKQRGLDAGARRTGAFLVDLPPSLASKHWKAPSEQPTLKWYTSNLSLVNTDITRLRLSLEKTFAYDIREIGCYARHEPSLGHTQYLLDAFEIGLTQAKGELKETLAPPYAINVDADTAERRQKLGLALQSPIAKLDGNVLPRSSMEYPGIHTPEAFVSSPGFGTPFGAHLEDFNLEAVNVLAHGAPKVWIVIPERHADRFEELVQRQLNVTPTCAQFVRHHYSWPTRAALKEANIQYTVIHQQAGQAVITLSRCYHFGFNVGANIAEALNYGDETWVKDGYIGCHSKCSAPNSRWISHEGLTLHDHRRSVSVSRTSESSPALSPGPSSTPESAETEGENIEAQTPQSDQEAGDAKKPKIKYKGAVMSKKRGSKENGAAISKKSRSTEISGGSNKDGAKDPPGNLLRSPAQSSVLLDYAAEEKAKYDQCSFGIIDRFIDIDQLRTKLSKCSAMTDSETEVVMRLYHAVGSAESLVMLREIISAHRQQEPDCPFDRGGLSPAERRSILDSLDCTISRFCLMRRCHLVRLCEEMQMRTPRNAFINQTSAGIRGANGAKRGNPISAAQYSDNRRLLDKLFPGVRSDSADDPMLKKRQNTVNEIRRAGIRYKSLVDRFGFGILGLIPTTGGGSLNVSDTLLLSLSERAFYAFLRSLEYKAGVTSTLSTAAGGAVIALFEGTLSSSQRLNLEQEGIDQILSEPGSSPKFLRLLEWQEP